MSMSTNQSVWQFVWHCSRQETHLFVLPLCTQYTTGVCFTVKVKLDRMLFKE